MRKTRLWSASGPARCVKFSASTFRYVRYVDCVWLETAPNGNIAAVYANAGAVCR